MENRKKIKITYILFSIILGGWLLLPPKEPLIPEYNQPTKNNDIESSYKIFGFLPYWNYNKVTQSSLNSVTDLIYFSLRLQTNGTIQTNTTPLSEEPGWTTFKKIKNEDIGDNITLSFTLEKPDNIGELLASSSYRSSAIDTILNTTKSIGANGINIDFEPAGGIAPSVRSNFVLFINELKERITNTSDNYTLSIDIYPTAASRIRLWDLSSLEPNTDYFVVMTYDYHRSGSTSAGPNAPLRRDPLNYDEDIIKNIAEITSVVPSNKILLGIPFYGYEWATTTADKYSSTEGGAIASIARIDKLVEEKSLPILWDRVSLTPYIVHTEDGLTKQIYFDNEQSISLKLDLVKQGGLGGIAIWALGYEGNNESIWNEINSLNR